jgi:hypothetical protein
MYNLKNILGNGFSLKNEVKGRDTMRTRKIEGSNEKRQKG